MAILFNCRVFTWTLLPSIRSASYWHFEALNSAITAHKKVADAIKSHTKPKVPAKAKAKAKNEKKAK